MWVSVELFIFFLRTSLYNLHLKYLPCVSLLCVPLTVWVSCRLSVAFCHSAAPRSLPTAEGRGLPPLRWQVSAAAQSHQPSGLGTRFFSMGLSLSPPFTPEVVPVIYSPFMEHFEAHSEKYPDNQLSATLKFLSKLYLFCAQGFLYTSEY